MIIKPSASLKTSNPHHLSILEVMQGKQQASEKRTPNGTKDTLQNKSTCVLVCLFSQIPASKQKDTHLQHINTAFPWHNFWNDSGFNLPKYPYSFHLVCISNSTIALLKWTSYNECQQTGKMQNYLASLQKILQQDPTT